MPIFFWGQADQDTDWQKKKKIFLTPWHLLVSSQLVTRTVEKEFLLNFSACPQDTELKTHTSRACPKAVGPSTSLRDGSLFGSSLRVRMSLGWPLSASYLPQPVWWTGVLAALSSSNADIYPGSVKKYTRSEVLYFLVCLSAFTCHQPGLLHPPRPHGCQGLSTTSHVHLDIWTFSSAIKMLFPSLRKEHTCCMAFGINTCNCLFDFFSLFSFSQ